MSTPFESAQLNLKLYELRREPVLREARSWFLLEFNPESFEELMSIARGERNPSVRMVLGYWEMASSMVTSGAIDADSFLAAHGEIVATFAKIAPYLKELREATGESQMCKHTESVVMSVPDVEAIMKRRTQMLRLAAKARQAATAQTR